MVGSNILQITNRGQSLIEVLVALSAVLVLLSAMTIIVLTSLTQSISSKQQAVATQYAQQGLELMKGESSFESGIRTYPMGESEELGTPPCTAANLGGIYRRCVTVSTITAECLPLVKVSVEVAWTDASCNGQQFCKKIPISSCL